MTMHSDHYDGTIFDNLGAHLTLLAIVVIAAAVPAFLFYVL
jgi:hypothetical protein